MVVTFWGFTIHFPITYVRRAPLSCTQWFSAVAMVTYRADVDVEVDALCGAQQFNDIWLSILGGPVESTLEIEPTQHL